MLCNLSFLLGGTITKLAVDKFTRSKTIFANFMKLCALTFHNWLKLHVENTNVEKNYRSPSLSLLQIRKFIPAIWVADNVSLLNRQFDFPVAQDQRFCHKIVSYHKITHQYLSYSIIMLLSSCLKKHTSASIYIKINTIYHQRHILSQSPYPKHCQQPMRKKRTKKHLSRESVHSCHLGSKWVTWWPRSGMRNLHIPGPGTFELMISLFHPFPVGYVRLLKTSLNLM